VKPKVDGRNLVGLVGRGVHPLIFEVNFNISMWVPPSYQILIGLLVFDVFFRYLLPYFSFILWNALGVFDEPTPMLVL
jgi:hypothetical protein